MATTAESACSTEEELVVMKRLPAHLPKRPTDVYVTNKSSFSGQLNRSWKILLSDKGEVHIHGMGQAMERAINLALSLKERSAGALAIETTTDTVKLTDDLLSLFSDELTTRSRLCSAVHIRLYWPSPA